MGYAFKLQLVSCFYLTGLIWTIQVVHYPAYNYIDPSKFLDYQIFHTKWITPVVAPLMIIELGTAFLILMDNKNDKLWIINFLGVVLIWGVTFLLSVPAHSRLNSGMDLKSIQFLILTNWLRTILWTARSGLLLYCWR